MKNSFVQFHGFENDAVDKNRIKTEITLEMFENDYNPRN